MTAAHDIGWVSNKPLVPQLTDGRYALSAGALMLGRGIHAWALAHDATGGHRRHVAVWLSIAGFTAAITLSISKGIASSTFSLIQVGANELVTESKVASEKVLLV
jgi:hypothetical protein